MNKTLKYKNKNICYKTQGEGTPLVFLHGYLESKEIWDDFLTEFNCGYLLISIDLPGHGKTDSFDDIHTMDFMAECVKAILDHLKVEKAFIIGHSMGGYVTLAFADKYPEMIMGISLFHSHPFADSPEIIEKRKKEIAFVLAGKKDMIAKLNTPNAFANYNLDIFSAEVQRSIDLALATTQEGIIANLNGMMQRPDRSHIISKGNIPCLLIMGKKDNYIIFDTVFPKIKLNKYSELLILDYSGHMGFIEKSGESKKSIIKFIENIIIK